MPKFVRYVMERIVSWYLTRENIAWVGECEHHRSPDALISTKCPECEYQ